MWSRTTSLSFGIRTGCRGGLWLAEIMGSGVGILDFDGDSRMDLWLIQGGPLDDRHLATQPPLDRLYQNVPGDHGVRFIDTTRDSGVIATRHGPFDTRRYHLVRRIDALKLARP